MRTPSLWQIAILVLIVVVIFGAARLPSIAQSIGQSLKVFKKEVKELRDDEEPASSEDFGGGAAGGASSAGSAGTAGTAAPGTANEHPTAGSPPKTS